MAEQQVTGCACWPTGTPFALFVLFAWRSPRPAVNVTIATTVDYLDSSSLTLVATVNDVAGKHHTPHTTCNTSPKAHAP